MVDAVSASVVVDRAGTPLHAALRTGRASARTNVLPCCLLAFLVFLNLPGVLFAHRLDEYLQATLVSIEPGKIRFEINLTPGVAVADQVLAQIDRDHDGVISTNEAAAYADSLRHDLGVRLDGHEVGLNCDSFTFPAPAELRTGLGIILLEFSVKTGTLASGAHKLSFENRHLPKISVYLFNAALPRHHFFQITGQKRNETQSNGEITFDFHGQKTGASTVSPPLRFSRRTALSPAQSTASAE